MTYVTNTGKFFSPLQIQQEAELKSSGSKKLNSNELSRLKVVLTSPTDPLFPIEKGSLKPLFFSTETVVNFFTKKLSETGILDQPSVDIGGGAARYILQELEYADVDLSFYICKPSYDKIINIIEAFLLDQFELNGIEVGFATQFPKKSIHDVYPYRIEFINNNKNHIVALFIGLGGIEIKFISDKKYRWNVASCDCFYIKIPENTVHCIDNCIPLQKKGLDKCLSDLKTRKFIVQDPQNVSSFLFRILLFQTQGFDVSQEDIALSLKKFKWTFPAYATEKLTKKVHHFWSSHYRKHELPRMFSYLNFLSLILQLEDQIDSQTYIQAISTSWLQRTYQLGEKRRFLLLSDLVQQKPQLIHDLLTLIYGAFLYEYTLLNPAVSAYIFEFSSEKNKPLYQIGLKQEEMIHYLKMFKQNPVELAMSVLKSWSSLIKEECHIVCDSTLKDLGFTELRFTLEGKYKLITQFLKSFSQEPLASILLTQFPKTNPQGFYKLVSEEMLQSSSSYSSISAFLEARKELPENAVQLFERINTDPIDSIDKNMVLAKLALKAPANYWPQSNLDKCLHISNELLSSKIEDQASKELHKLGIKLLCFLAECNKDSQWHDQIHFCLLKGMASALCIIHPSQCHERYAAVQKAFAPLKNMPKTLNNEIKVLSNLTKRNFQTEKSIVIKSFIHSLIKIDISIAKRVFSNLSAQLIHQNDKLEMDSALLMGQFHSLCNKIQKTSFIEKEAAEILEELIKLLQSTSILRKKDTQDLRKIILSLIRDMILSHYPQAFRFSIQLFLESKNIGLIDVGQCAQSDEIVLLILQQTLITKELKEIDGVRGILDYILHDSRFIEFKGFKELIQNILTLLSCDFGTPELLALRVLNKALNGDIWGYLTEVCFIQALQSIQLNVNNSEIILRECEKIIKTLVSKKLFEKKSAIKNISDIINILINLDEKKLLKLPKVEIALQILSSFSQVPQPLYTDEAFNQMEKFLKIFFSEKIVSCSQEHSSSFMQSLNSIFTFQDGDLTISKKSIEFIYNAFYEFLLVKNENNKLDHARIKSFNKTINKDFKQVFNVLIQKFSYLAIPFDMVNEVKTLCIIVFEYLSDVRDFGHKLFVPIMEQSRDVFQNLLKQKELDFDTFKYLYSSFNDIIASFAAFNPDEGAKILREIIQKSLNSNPEWCVEAHKALLKGIENDLFYRKNVGTKVREMDQKELEESESSLVVLFSEISVKACQAKNSADIALESLCEARKLVQNADSTAWENLYSAALQVSNRMLISVFGSHDQSGYNRFIDEFLEIFLSIGISQEMCPTFVYLIIEFIGGLERFPEILNKIEKVAKEMNPHQFLPNKPHAFKEFSPSEIMIQVIKTRTLIISDNCNSSIKPAVQMMQRFNQKEFYNAFDSKNAEVCDHLRYRVVRTLFASPLFLKGFQIKVSQLLLIPIVTVLNDHRVITNLFKYENYPEYRNFMVDFFHLLLDHDWPASAYKELISFMGCLLRRLLYIPEFIKDEINEKKYDEKNTIGRKKDISSFDLQERKYIEEMNLDIQILECWEPSIYKALSIQEMKHSIKNEVSVVLRKIVLEGLQLYVSSKFYTQTRGPHRKHASTLLDILKMDAIKVYPECIYKDFINQMDRIFANADLVIAEKGSNKKTKKKRNNKNEIIMWS